MKNKRNGIVILMLLFLMWNACLNSHKKNGNVQENHLLTQEREINLGEVIRPSKNVVFESAHHFNQYEVEVLKGKLAQPSFEGNSFAEEESYIEFITEGCEQNGINFGGKYTIITRSCGLMCEHLYIIDRKTGEIFTEINPNEGRWGYAFQPNSTMMIANSSLFQGKAFQAYEDNGHQQPELYIWKENNFEKIQ